jgi:iron complex outermembrane receptor protein
MRLGTRRTLQAALVLTLAPVPLLAQGGTLRGRVADSAGTALPQATVVLEAAGRGALSNERGEYVMSGIPAGTYRVAVRRLGYTAEPARVTVRAGEETRQDFTMARAAVGLAEVQVVVGSRAAHTAADELAVPVDVFTPAEIRAQGTTETAQILAQLAPSVNFPRQSVSDASEIVRPFTMRGLGPDHSLVLLNGKRRHRTAIVHYYGAGLGAGSSGVDMNTIPASAIERIEVLREGAAAQYGSDAIAGVVNVVLRDGVFAPQFDASFGQYATSDFPDDGRTFNLAGAWGIPLGRGALALSAEYRDRDGTNRAGADVSDQLAPGDADEVDAFGQVISKNNPVPQPNHHWGDGEEQALMTFASANLPLGTTGQSGLYAFGGYTMREGKGYGYYRQAMSERNWTEIYPLGFLPQFAPDVVDASAAGGLRGLAGSWQYDAGVSFGLNTFLYNIENSLNTSLGPCLDTPCAPGPDGILGNADDPGIANKTSFDAGELGLTETTLSLDVSRQFEIGLPTPLNFAVGAAYRRETYQITPGEPASWINGFHPDQYGDPSPSGSQVFPGFRPEDDTDADRDNVGLYVDVESDIAPRLLANVAARWENYSDFGSRLTGKVALRFQPATPWTFRAAASTGFRAPSLAQSYYSSTVTNFIPDLSTGEPLAVEVGVFPVASAEAQALGARPLKEETSVNLSAGLAWSPVPRLTITADAFQIDVDDRVLLTTFLASDEVAAILAGIGSRATSGQYFTNAIDTRTRGVDVTARYRIEMGATRGVDLDASYNYTQTDVVGDIPLPPELAAANVVLFDQWGEGGINALERERPRWRATLQGLFNTGGLSVMGRGSFYGPFRSSLYSYCLEPTTLPSCAQEYPTEAIFDLELGYGLPGLGKLAVGARNVFDNYPERMNPDNSFGLFLYPSASPFGFNGRFIYTRLEVGVGR